MHWRQRTRLRPGPLFAAAIVTLVLVLPSPLQAHEPGLSALEVQVAGRQVSAVLSLAPADAAALMPAGGAEPTSAIGAIASDGIQLVVEQQRIRGVVERVVIEDGSARVFLSFVLPPGPLRGDVGIVSSIPKQMALGHRELVVVRVDGRTIERLLDANVDRVSLGTRRAATPHVEPSAGFRFASLGVHHILSGWDHLAFLIGLLLAARNLNELVGALTAFTAAHSVTLALAVSGVVRPPPAIVEPLIAVSIAWVGLEILLGASHGARWLVVFGFGLVHGFGFGGALSELGLGSTTRSLVVSLFSFNAGVELGQLTVVAVLWPFAVMLKARARLVAACSALMVVAGGYWLAERLLTAIRL